MSRLNRTSICLLIICTAIFANPSSALAVPTLPSSFYGTVKLNNAKVPDGTVVQAFIGTQVLAQAYSQTYQGDSVYSLDVPGDNTDTVVIDGGREGDTITFKVGGILATGTGTWHTATNVQLNLTVTSASTPLPPQATPTHLPTQTQLIINQQPSKTPTPTPTPTLTILASPTVIIPSLETKSPGLPTPTLWQPAPSLPVPGDQKTDINRSLGIAFLIMALVVLILMGVGFIVWIRRRK